VNLLDRFEQRVEHLMEGSIGRIFRSPIQPAEIGQKLERAMTERPVASVSGLLAPNHFRVRLNPRDLAQFADYQTALQHQFETWLTDIAQRRGLALVDRIQVELTPNERLPRRAIEVTAIIAEPPGGSRAELNQADLAGHQHPYLGANSTASIRLRFLNGPQHGLEAVLSAPVTTVGRSPGNDLILDVSDVSRHHARLERDGGELRVVDLGSTNGTRVNGEPVRVARLRPGDEISFGTIRARLLNPE
jgi:hypothetical protein